MREISTKVKESRLRWHGYMRRKEESYVERRMMAMEVPREGEVDQLEDGWTTSQKIWKNLR